MFQFLKKIKLETIFVVIGVLSVATIATVTFYAINFLVNALEISLKQAGAGAQKATSFNLEGLKTLGLIKESKEESPNDGTTTTPPTSTTTVPAATVSTTTIETGTTTDRIATTTESATTSKPNR